MRASEGCGCADLVLFADAGWGAAVEAVACVRPGGAGVSDCRGVLRRSAMMSMRLGGVLVLGLLFGEALGAVNPCPVNRPIVRRTPDVV